MQVTVCIPVYRAGNFLADTLRSVLNQTHTNFRLLLGIDPCAEDGTGQPEDSLAALAPFLADKRIEVMHNTRRLGWDANINALLQQVNTPYYVVLPHDDLWVPHYLEQLLSVLQQHPHAISAYGDMRTFGTGAGWRKAVQLPGSSDMRAQLLAFFLQGAEAMPWRGLTRSEYLPVIGGFPVDGNKGFAVECEYAQLLITAAPVVHVPRTLYVKRVHTNDVLSASRERIATFNHIELRSNWSHHATRMHSILVKALGSARGLGEDGGISDELLTAALGVAMWRRCQINSLFDLADVAAVEQILAALPPQAPAARQVAARINALFCRHEAQRNPTLALQYAEAALALDPGYVDACLLLAQLLCAAKDHGRALQWLNRAGELFPNGVGQAPLRKRLQQALAVQ